MRSAPYVTALLMLIALCLPVLWGAVGGTTQDEATFFDPVVSWFAVGKIAAPHLVDMPGADHGMSEVFYLHPTGNEAFLGVVHAVVGQGFFSVRIAALLLRLGLLALFADLARRGRIHPWSIPLVVFAFLAEDYTVLSVARPDLLAGTWLLLGVLALRRTGAGQILASGLFFGLALWCHPLTAVPMVAALATVSLLELRAGEAPGRLLQTAVAILLTAGTVFVGGWFGPFLAWHGPGSVPRLVEGFLWHADLVSAFWTWIRPTAVDMLLALPMYVGVTGISLWALMAPRRDAVDRASGAAMLVTVAYILVFTWAGNWYFLLLAPLGMFLLARAFTASPARGRVLLGGGVLLLGLGLSHRDGVLGNPLNLALNGAAEASRHRAVIEQVGVGAGDVALTSPIFYHALVELGATTRDVEAFGRWAPSLAWTGWTSCCSRTKGVGSWAG
jgi:hypothetical protein